MKNVNVRVARPVRVVFNTLNANKHQWAKIVCAKSGTVLHTGQVPYIKRVAMQCYNAQIS